MDQLLVQRRVLKGQVTRFEKALTPGEGEALTEACIKLYSMKIDKLTADMDVLQGQIALACKEEQEFETHEQEYSDISNRLDAMKVLCIASQGMTSSAPKAISEIRLPKLELPVFAGSYEDWLTFYDLFTATVHNNSILSSAQKLQYLKSSVKGEASLLIQAIPVTDGNYQEAWDILINRYNNCREIVDAHVSRLFALQKVQQENASSLRRLLDNATECCRSLRVLKAPVEHWDIILIHLIKGKLDQESRRQWELSLRGDKQPSFQELVDFLDRRSRALAASQPKDSRVKGPNNISRNNYQATNQSKPSIVAHHETTQAGCAACEGNHFISKCPEFLKQQVSERRKVIQKQSMCFNCLQKGHHVQECKSSHCRKCKGKHHTLLHYDHFLPSAQDHIASTSKDSDQKEERELSSHLSHDQGRFHQIFLSTAIVLVKDARGQLQSVRALLDSASQGSFVTERCIQLLQLKRQFSDVSVSGIGAAGSEKTRGIVSLTIHSQSDRQRVFHVHAYVLPKVTKLLPSTSCDPSEWRHLQGLQLADPTFHTPSEIDLLLGADVYADLLESGCCKGSPGTPNAYKTVFGWVVSGSHRSSSSEPNRSVTLECHHSTEDKSINDAIKKFWEIEELPSQGFLTKQESTCEEYFKTTHTRTPSGRYVVRLPFQDQVPCFGDSKESAVRRFTALERRLQTKEEIGQLYRDFMLEYETLGHMEQLKSSDMPGETEKSFYLPHHAVMRERSTTTKLRVVFDASAISSTGTSLNNELLVGPKLQSDLINILLRFRTHVVALTADINKMYRQIWIHPADTDYQRIVWRHHPDRPLRDYRLLTVTYGTAAAPHLATKVLQQLANDEEKDFPEAADVLKNDFYMDDLLSGSSSTKQAKILHKQLVALLRRGGFELRKWISSDKSVMESVAPELRDSKEMLHFDGDDSVKILGLEWNPESDQFLFSVCPCAQRQIVTKRHILSDTMKVFDPLGFLAPHSIRAKLILQQLWQLRLDWDEAITDELANQWKSFQNDLKGISHIRIQRCISPAQSKKTMLFAFCDASEKAYAAVTYLCTINQEDIVNVQLVTAKTRVAPLKTISLPRLELCGAVLLSKLVKLVLGTLKVRIDGVYAWTDSTIVLAWLSSSPQRWKTFVANRVSEIQETIPSSNWRHISGMENPADCATRGLTSDQLVHHNLWWHGPSWLTKLEFSDPKPERMPRECTVEERVVITATKETVADNTILLKYSSLSKLVRVTSYIRRFIFNARSQRREREVGPLSPKELHLSLLHWVRHVQAQHFHQEIACIKKNKPLQGQSKIVGLRPFLDPDGIVRVGGRLKNSSLSPDQIHPILLPKRSKITELLIDYEHRRHLHAGPQLLMVILQRRFWILSARDVIRFHIRRCIQCTRQRAETAQQLMSQLPAVRVTPSRPFLVCGVDYAGPLMLKLGKGRSQRTTKGYIAVFICFSTRALHLELVSDMTSESFIAALKRFVARRGKCSTIYSDCGSNFVGASRELKEVRQAILNKEHNNPVAIWLAGEGISWKFNPPAAPHFGGFWEAGVKSVKFHLKRVIGPAKLTFEEMTTLLCQVEGCLNSRPLTALSSDPSDLKALTPGHFLVGDVITAIPESDLTPIPENRLNRWQRCQQMLQHFWRRWNAEYLSRLQQRPKWAGESRDIQVGDLVLLKESLPPTLWKLGRVIEVHPGSEKKVRVVTVRTAEGDLKRPIVKLCLLPLEN